MEAISILRAKVCECGRAKPVRKAFCIRCWRRLSEPTRQSLYRRLGGGFESAYTAALEEIRNA